jgi:NADP-dependent 3-hydroxy acid dehydrogenase YdfG
MTGGQADRVIVITGASRGIGAALAELAGRAGAAVVLVARSESLLSEVAARSGDLALPIVADVTRRHDIQKVVADAIERFGHIDVLVNNAGQGITRQPSELTDEDIDEMMTVNVKSVLYGMQEVLPHFKSRGRGHIINVSSLLGRMPYAAQRSSYCGAKHFLNALTWTFRTEVQLTHPDIQVSLVSPGVVRTEFGLNARHGGVDSRVLPESQSAEEVARVLFEVIETRRPDVYTTPGAHARVVSYFTSTGEDPLMDPRL